MNLKNESCVISLSFLYILSQQSKHFKYLFKNITVFKGFPGIKLKKKNSCTLNLLYEPQDNSRTNGVAITNIKLDAAFLELDSNNLHPFLLHGKIAAIT